MSGSLPIPRLIVALLCAAGCQDSPASFDTDPSQAALGAGSVAAPAPLVEVDLGGRTMHLWPFAQAGLTGRGEDPINLIFRGTGDPLNLRAALMALDGDRSAYGMPFTAPFDCTWTDAIGTVMAGYAEPVGWSGSVVQLACGAYGPIRFHLRLFDAGDQVIANAHFEVLIPGTADHQVLSWELAEQLVTVDLIRTGLLSKVAPVGLTVSINPSPFRTIDPLIYNGLPTSLRALIGGPLADVSTPVDIATDGHASVLNLERRFAGKGLGSVEEFDVQYGQVIPKPFCGQPGDFVYVQGPVHLAHRVTLDGRILRTRFDAAGSLQVTPFDPVHGTPSGPPISAQVSETQNGFATADRHSISSLIRQSLDPISAPGNGLHTIRLVVASNGEDRFEPVDKCGG